MKVREQKTRRDKDTTKIPLVPGVQLKKKADKMEQSQLAD